MNTPVVELKNLTKSFGSQRGVTNLNLTISSGDVVGFLGPNGAGKSTTMNMLIGLTSPTEGHANLFGKTISLHISQLRNDLGFLASDTALDGGLTGRQQLEYFGHLRNMNTMEYAWDVAGRLDTQLNKPIRTLSRGNRQKIALVAALMHKPQLLLLDEPTSGLDPLMQSTFNDMIREHRKAGGTTFISSHVLSEIEELCDVLIFIRDGKIIAQTTQAELRAAAPKRVSVTTTDPLLYKALGTLIDAKGIQSEGSTLEFAYKGDLPKLLRVLTSHDLTDVTIADYDLEDSFMQFYGEGEQQT